MPKIKKAPAEGTKRAALYIRVSTHHQLDKDSLPFQRQELSNYAKYALGIDDIEIFEDAGYSGKNTERPAYQRMMHGVRSGLLTHILVWKIDRISRNLMDFTKMYEELKKYGVTFISKNEQFDTSSAMGEAMLKIILVFAELERQLTAERVTSIMYSRAEKGLWNGAPIPIGYMWSEENKYPVPNPEEAPRVLLLFEKYAELKSVTKVREYLNAQGLYTKRGNTWNTNTIRKVIRNPFFKGTYRYNYTTSTGTIKPLAEQIVHHDNHDAIVSKELWQTCNDIMDKNAQRTVSGFLTGPRATHVFSNLIKCGECGDSFGAGVDKKRTDGYVPSKYRCISHQKRRGCTNLMITDVTLGPFVFNYISNLYAVQKKLENGIISMDEMEKMLLRGNVFKNVTGMNQESLKDTYLALTQGYVYEQQDDGDNAILPSELETLQEEKKKFERAHERLQNLYLFSEETMSEKDYIVRKKGIEDSIDDINEKIQLIYERNKEITDIQHQPDFLKEATYFMLVEELSRERRYILDFKKLTTQYDKSVLKSFINSIVKSIVVLNGLVTSVTFKNGLTHEFIYRD